VKEDDGYNLLNLNYLKYFQKNWVFSVKIYFWYYISGKISYHNENIIYILQNITHFLFQVFTKNVLWCGKKLFEVQCDDIVKHISSFSVDFHFKIEVHFCVLYALIYILIILILTLLNLLFSEYFIHYQINKCTIICY